MVVKFEDLRHHGRKFGDLLYHGRKIWDLCRHGRKKEQIIVVRRLTMVTLKNKQTT